MITQTSFERLFIDGLRAAERLAETNLLANRTVLTVCAEIVRPRNKQIRYVQVPVFDAQPLSFDVVDEVMRTIARNILAGRFLIHCAAGLPRANSSHAPAWFVGCQ